MVTEAQSIRRTIRIFAFASAGFSLFAGDPTALLNSARTAKNNHDILAAGSAYDSALELALEEPGPRLSGIASEVATFYLQQNNPEKALAVLNRSLDREDSAHFAPIDEISVLMRLADVYSQQRRLTDLASTQKRIVKAWEASAGSDAVVVANTLYRLANTQLQSGDLPGGRESITRAIQILEAKLGEASATAHALVTLGQIEKSLGNPAGQKAAVDQGIAITQKQNPVEAENVGRGVSPPRVISRVDPQYSEEARTARIQGSIDLSLIVDEKGNPQNVTVEVPLGAGLDEMAVEAVRNWRFQPGEKDGVPVRVKAAIQVNMRLL
jgi:TonB family protein